MKTIIFSVLCFSLALSFSQNIQAKNNNQKSNSLPVVVVKPATYSKLNDEIEALGNLEASESIIVTSKVTEVATKIEFDDGQKVKKGQLLVQLRDAEQRAQLRIAQVNLKNNERELNRIKTLVEEQSVAELEQDRLQTAIDTAKANRDSALADLKDRQIKAPFSGVLGLRKISVGSLVTPGTEITTLDNISTLKLDFTIPERYLQVLKPGKVVEALAVAYPGEVFKGKVKSIDTRIDPTTRAVVVRAQLDNSESKLLPGMLMTIDLIKETRTALIIPESAIIPRQDRQYVYIVNDKNEVVQQQVEIGLRKLGIVEIVNGLKKGDKVITRGFLKVRPGDKVQPQNDENFTYESIKQGSVA
ncbi:efflux RND transporter periplasmic adaptor subunit [Shewanella sp. 202IG2-18]|uniref:efflux RND transporter periplasmic adaptor subunit n=1 Tax=Parashewanella hymeniacidonis TaxID=2807618 RepID=UPI00195FC893|nr:efflux RND transporter periplasmic adaptor subunit [Parashewanella hymeniacidonis]MBM7072767.1 efflux RND transporter periplasmic adaptor subunit [Parashewanella hymeniacidonis]